jgi:hypothetical protein
MRSILKLNLKREEIEVSLGVSFLLIALPSPKLGEKLISKVARMSSSR